MTERQQSNHRSLDGTPPEDESRLTSQPASPLRTDLYSEDELRRIRDAIEAYQEIKKDLQRHRDHWLKIVGPVLVMIREKAFEVTGTTNVTSQAYRDAIGEELRRTGLIVVEKTTRSYLLKIMDNISDVEAWLAERPNADRLNHPKTPAQPYHVRLCRRP
jgi:hypothetical protein